MTDGSFEGKNPLCHHHHRYSLLETQPPAFVPGGNLLTESQNWDEDFGQQDQRDHKDQ